MAADIRFALPSAAVRVAAFLALCSPVLPLIDYAFIRPVRGYDGIEARIGLMMAGCTAAFLLNSPRWRARLSNIPAWPVVTATVLWIFYLAPRLADGLDDNSFIARSERVTFPSFHALSIACLLLVLIAGKPGLAVHILDLPIMRHLGKLSYSIYVWQELFLVPNTSTSYLPLLWRLPAIYLVALCSYHFLERPFVRLRSKYRHA